MTIQDLKPGAWEGERCFLVGGGPSLRNFDWSLLEGELTIGINRAVESFVPTIAYARDEPFARWLKNGKFGAGATQRWADHHCAVIFGQHNTDLLFECERKSNNSGLGALRLAVALGASEVYLLGFDMGNHDGAAQQNFHDGYPIKQKKSVYEQLFIPAFESFAREAKRAAKIINLNPDSNLRCFDFGPFPVDYPLKEPRAGLTDIYIDGNLGIGDNLLYQRPFLQVMAERFNIYLRTSTPEVYHDIEGIFPVRVSTILRTQTKNASRAESELWYSRTPRAKKFKWPPYWDCFKIDKNIWPYLSERLGVNIADLNSEMPLRPEWIADARVLVNQWDTGGRPICLLKRPTVREEWVAESRNPKAGYISKLVDRYRNDFFFVSIADTAKGVEWFIEDLDTVDREYHRGELPLTTIYGLTHFSGLLISAVGFFLTLGIVTRIPTVIVYGGAQKPEWLEFPEMGLDKHLSIAPSPFCACNTAKHKCDKEIPESVLFGKFDTFLLEQGLTK